MSYARIAAIQGFIEGDVFVASIGWHPACSHVGRRSHGKTRTEMLAVPRERIARDGIEHRVELAHETTVNLVAEVEQTRRGLEPGEVLALHVNPSRDRICSLHLIDDRCDPHPIDPGIGIGRRNDTERLSRFQVSASNALHHEASRRTGVCDRRRQFDFSDHDFWKPSDVVEGAGDTCGVVGTIIGKNDDIEKIDVKGFAGNPALLGERGQRLRKNGRFVAGRDDDRYLRGGMKRW